MTLFRPNPPSSIPAQTPVFIQVAIDVPLFTTFTYAVPAAWREAIAPGQLVQVPFRNRSKTGLIMSVSETLADASLASRIKEMVDIVDTEPLLSSTGLEFLNFVADYYFAPIGEVVRLAVPSAVRVEGMKHYRLRDDHPPKDGLSEPLMRAFDALEGKGQVAIRAIKEAVSNLTYVVLSELEQLGYVDVFYEEEKAGVRALCEKFYQLARGPQAGERLGSTQAAIVALLEGGQAVALSALREKFKSPHASLTALEERGFLTSWSEEVYRDPFADESATQPKLFEPTPAQASALDAIASARLAERFQGFVLHGVTGSGKTEVYVRAIRDTLAAKKSALVLLPEIALTPQFVGIFRGHFGQRIAVLHSGLSQAEKFDQWRRIKRNEVEIVIGARSAIFAPLERLGIIVVDEEHDSSFKQEEGPRYNARDMALVRGKLEGAQVVLGSATPVLESYYGAKNARLVYLPMPERVASRPLPVVHVVDMRGGRNTPEGADQLLSTPLLAALAATFQEHQQAILFLNRRGHSPCVLCESCGHVFRCPNCDVSLTYHRRQEALRCHHCDFSLRMPENCPQCSFGGIGRKGTGTEKLESHVQSLFANARVARLDRDTSSGKNLQKIIGRFRDGEVDLLVGTQMVTKGHDFPGVTTVGVVAADMSLNFPDFRAAERTFQLLTQVAGRAGRGEAPGNVFVQSFMPEHYSLTTAQHHDYASFARRELSVREELHYPPFTHLIAIKFEATSEAATIQAARDYAAATRRQLRRNQELADNITMLGPAMAPIARINNRARWQLLLKSPSRPLLRQLARALLTEVGHFEPAKSGHRSVRVVVDVDPINML
ncbi:MAG: primosomal protein N' [Bradymonadaceae bacterium]|nr:primosomal protein N' [Lujinxingiaceae bacterium]